MKSELLLFLHAMKSSRLCLQDVRIPKAIQFLFFLAMWTLFSGKPE